MKITVTALLTMFAFMGCQNNEAPKRNATNEETLQPKVAQEYSLVGRKALIVYPEFKAMVTYISDSTLRWKTTTTAGMVHEGDEKVFLKKLNNHQYFLNWIEKDELSISQVIDLEAKTVVAFGTFADEKSERGKRSSMRLEGTFEVIE